MQRHKYIEDLTVHGPLPMVPEPQALPSRASPVESPAGGAIIRYVNPKRKLGVRRSRSSSLRTPESYRRPQINRPTLLLTHCKLQRNSLVRQGIIPV